MTIFIDDKSKEYYELFLEERGSYLSAEKVTSSLIEKWQEKLPNNLLYIWQELGLCHFNNGLLSIVNPNDYAYLVDTWLAGTHYQQIDNFHCYARTAFGECFLYGEKSRGFIEIMPQHNTIWANDNDLMHSQSKEDADLDLMLKLYKENEDYDFEDNQQELLFERAVDKLGVLKADEMYAFKPFLRLLPDEKVTIDHLIKVRMDVYTDMLYQFEPPTSRGTSFSDIYK